MNQEFCDFSIQDLGERTIPSSVNVNYYTSDNERVLYNIYLEHYKEFTTPDGKPLSLEVAGPREKIFFDPVQTKAAIVTCGGLCPGINDVIRAIIMELFYRYGVKDTVGIKYGFQGLIPKYGHQVIELTPDVVKDIHTSGGSLLSSSRGMQEPSEMVNTLKRMNVDILFCIGGDGTMRGARFIAEEITKRNLIISVIGIPKTIDNDLTLIQKSFGFDTAISEAEKVIQCSHVEAHGAPMGIGLVKIMGRLSGHIAAGAALAQGDVNFILIPEVPFDLYGENAFLSVLEKRLKKSGHAVILVAEGAGQELLRMDNETIGRDASGNIKLLDIGLFLKTKIEDFFKKTGLEINLKYIDPSYIIRSVPANASDSIYCGALGQYAVHAGMAGKTSMLVGLVRDEYVHIPFRMIASGAKINPEGNIWMRVLETTGQPSVMRN